MSRAFGTRCLATALIEEALVPEECGDIEILRPVNGAVTLSYRVFVRVEDLGRLSRAFARAATLEMGGA